MLHDWVRLGSRLVRLLRDHHHPEAHDSILNRLLTQARASVALRQDRARRRPEVAYPAELPIVARKDEIVAAIRDYQVIVVAGETGSGKTTQLPKMCLEAGLGIEAKIGCTQPRRVAALSISRRIAEELNVSWGREVGCKIRFDDRSSPETYMKLMTDGILLAETQGDPLLSEYNGLIIDEAHERSLNIDFLLGYLKGLLAKRPELKLIITSATIDTEAFSLAFGHAPIIEVSGRVFPVEVVYAPFDAASEESGDMTYIDAAVRQAEQVLGQAGRGDVLIFMPTERDIRETGELLKGRFAQEAEIIPLFGRLSSGEQQRAFAPVPRRKIIIATNIAETSLTIPGIRYVIDSGLARVSRYNARNRTKRLPIEPVSQSSANQRKGRSGRVENGICVRLYSAEDFNQRPPYTQPEIQRANLAEVILRMTAFRLGQIETFPFINPPSPGAIEGGYKLLQELGALDEARQLTPLGRDLAHLPIDPALGRMLLQAQREHAVRELLIIASGLSIQDPRERPLDQKDSAAAAHKRFADPHSDFLTLLNVWNAVHDQWERLRTQNQRRKFCKANFLSYNRMREWQDLHAQLHESLEDLGTLHLNESSASYDAIHRSILAGLLGHVGNRSERNVYKGASNRQMTIFPGSALFERLEKKKPVTAQVELPEVCDRSADAFVRDCGVLGTRTRASALLSPLGQVQKLKQRGGKQAQGRPASDSTAQPEWIMAGEIVETSRLFARTVAGIDPLWIIELAPHLCRVSHDNPHWSISSGRVLVEEKTTLYGLELRKRNVAYGNINPQEATRIFIRAALVEGRLLPEPTLGKHEQDETALSASQLLALASAQTRPPRLAYPFLEHNQRVRHKIETWQTRMRCHDLGDLDQALVDFYSKRMEDISSIDELNRLLRDHPEPGFLCVTESDLTGGKDLNFDAEAFPDVVSIGDGNVTLSYSYSPGEEHDGVTLKLARHLVQTIPASVLEWAVPGLREAQVAELLRSLPKAIRRELMPLSEKAAEAARSLRPTANSLREDLSNFIRRRYGIEIPITAWRADAVPQHLRPRIEVLDHNEKTIGAGRDPSQLIRQIETAKTEPAPPPPAWTRAAAHWERFGLTSWTFGDLPERLVVGVGPASFSANSPAVAAEKVRTDPDDDPDDQSHLYAWPGLQLEEGQVNLQLFNNPRDARHASLGGIRRLVELALEKDLAWLQKDLRGLSRLAPLCAGFCSGDALQAAAYANLRRYLLPDAPFDRLTKANFDLAVAQARRKLPGLAIHLIDRVEAILKARQEILRRFGPATSQVPIPPHTARTTPAPVQPGVLTGLSQLGTSPAPSPRRPSLVQTELYALLPADFLERIEFERLPHIPRYLKALLTRAERARLNPAKDQQRAQQLAPYQRALGALEATDPASEASTQAIREFRFMVEEFKVSLFAQELGTAFPISPKRLDRHLEETQSRLHGASQQASGANPKP